MSAQANITIFDGASTHVSHTLVGIGTKSDNVLGDQAYWREDLPTVPQMAQVRMATYRRVLKSGVERVELRFETPVMEAINAQNAFGYTAAPKVAHVPMGAAVFYFSPRATSNERKLVKQFVANALNNISTTVASATSGVAAELIHSSITAS